MDIKPDDVPNTLNLRSKGVINVVILTTERFDATWIDVISLRFGATGEESGAVHLMLGFCCLSSAANRVETQTHAYVTNLAQKSISVINTATNTVITTILLATSLKDSHLARRHTRLHNSPIYQYGVGDRHGN